MIYILDTDVFTLSELPDSPEYARLHSRVLDLDHDDQLTTTIITYEEQTRGWLAYAAKSRETRHQVKAYERLWKHLRVYVGFDVLEFDGIAAHAYDGLLAMKLRVGSSDLKIAAIALSLTGISSMRYDVVLVPFPFDDLTGSKVRPAVCLTDVLPSHRHVVLAFTIAA